MPLHVDVVLVQSPEGFVAHRTGERLLCMGAHVDHQQIPVSKNGPANVATKFTAVSLAIVGTPCLRALEVLPAVDA